MNGNPMRFRFKYGAEMVSFNCFWFLIPTSLANFQALIRRGIRMWEESTCLRFRENLQARDAIRYVLENGDSCFTEYIGRNGGFQDIISEFFFEL
jgi:hypothetical protein